MYCPDKLPATNKFTINKGTFDGFGGQTPDITFEGDAEIPDDVTEITTTDCSDCTDKADVWYTLDGRRLQGKPTTKGVYIIGGKKAVIYSGMP